jgi:alkanesulfonate monooxygenase SsuD/methylene tetrahydromethanopterin reductase-like flavin-dependent oxidoreductase (luciferase family)
MPKIEFGYIMPTESLRGVDMRSYSSTLHRALETISGVFDSAWTIDHLLDGDSAMMEGFTTLSYMAAAHPSLKFGNSVLCQSFRSPALLAKMTATLQCLSGGRFILGIGAGGNEQEYCAYGYDFPPGSVRVSQLEETLQIIRAMWTEKQATFAGSYYRVNGAFCEPKPDPLPPVMVGAFKPRMLRLTAKYADWWNASSSWLGQYRRMSGELDRACAEVGRDPATIRRTWGGGIAIARTQEKAEELGAVRINAKAEDRDFGFVGTPAQIIEQMRPFIDLGVDYFLFGCEGFPNLEPLELLVNEVFPALNSA